MRRQHLAERAPAGRALDVVADICGLHAQLMSSAELALWARVDGLDADAVARLLWEERVLVKTWAMRGTLHLLPSAEFSLWQGALGTYSHYLKPSWLRAFGVTREQLEQLITAVSDALDGPPLTRDELARAVADAAGSSELGDKLRESWGAMLKPAAFRGHLCFAPNAGQNVRFTRPDRWLPRWSPATDADAAVLAVTRRFLAAHGPATRDDFARWWATTPARAAKLLRQLADVAVAVDVEGTEAWMLADDLGDLTAASTPRAVRLLPAFDHYVVGATRHAAELTPADHTPRVYRAQGWLSPVILVDGRMDGIWRHERKGRRILVEIEPFVALPPWARRRVETEAQRLADHFGGSLELSWAA